MKKEAILLHVDAEDATRALTKRYLKRYGIDLKYLFFYEGYQLLQFLNIYYSLEHEVERDFIVVLDLKLPDCYGTDVLERIRLSDNPKIRDLPVIIFTVSDDQWNRDRCKDLRCSSYCIKAFHESALAHDLLKEIKACQTESTGIANTI